MLTVAPIWRAAALVLPLAAAVGCDWIPVRRRLDPALYPVPTRPGAAYLRDDPAGSRTRTAPGPAVRPDLAGTTPAEGRTLPPLPELTPISPEEALASSAPTPLLDAALVRAEAIRSAALSGHDEDDPKAEPPPPPEVVAPEFAPVPGSSEPATLAVSVVVETGADQDAPLPMPEDEAPSPDAVDATLPTPAPDAVDIPPLEPEPMEQEATPAPAPEVEPGDDHWRAELEDLRTLVEAEAGRGGGSAEVWASRRRVLDRIAAAEASGEIDDATLWQAVMTMLAEPEPDAMSTDPAAPEPPALRVARVAFCREVVGFGQIDPIDADACRAGQVVLVYCELEGVGYEPEGDHHASRISTTLEILPEADAPPLWREVRPVEDRCTRPRRDYFVGYRLALPGTLPPARYRLRVAQRDLIAGAEAVGELPFAIVPGP